MNITHSLQSKITLALKIFLIGMVRQFLAHTILTYGLKIPSFFSFIWVWKELIIAAVGIIIALFFVKNGEYRKKVLSHKRSIAIVTTIIISLIISLSNSIVIHGQSIIDFAVSAKFNYIPLIIFIVWLWASYIISEEHNKSLISTALTTIKWVLIFSLLRYGILHTIPNVLDRIGFSQPGMSIERTAGTPPPSLWLTEFYSGYVRNQWPFGWPLSLGFYLAAMRPLFYGLVLYKKNFSDIRGWWLLYIGIVISTYSRAARGIFLISSVLIALIVYRKYTKYIIALGVAVFIAVWIYIAWWGQSELFLRTRSDKGHIEYFFQWLDLVKQHRLRWLWAASVGPASNHIEWVEKVFNPENQYMQIWLEYGLFWVLSRVLSYLSILFNPFKKWLSLRTSRRVQSVSGETITYIGISISIIALSVAGMVLHPFVDSSSIYPFMLIAGIVYGYYHQYGKNKTIADKKLTKKEIKQTQKQQDATTTSQHTRYEIKTNNNWKKSISRYIPYVWTIVLSIFFVLQTYVTFWVHLIDNTIILSTTRDLFFSLYIIISIIVWWKYLLKFITTYWKIIIPIVILIIINIWYLIIGNINTLSVIAWIKYDIFQFIIIGWWLWLWYLAYIFKKWKNIYTYINRFLKRSLVMLCVGVLWQIGKNISPDIFLWYLWYSSPSDFVPYSKPPIYYITGAGWIERLSWLFVWPNTLGFFLILMTSVLYFYSKNKVWKIYIILWTILYFLVSLSTLSRWAIIGISLQILILIIYEGYLLWNKTLQSTTSLYKKKLSLIITTLILSGIALFIINMRKTDSNTERNKSWETIYTIVYENGIPFLWYGPWYVWPARHYSKDYQDNKKNDYAMLENIYLQTLINQWRIGISIFAIIFIQLLMIHNTIRKKIDTLSKPNDYILAQIAQYMGIGILWLLSIWLFLHIFIDSMVNYLFFLPYSIIIGYLYWIFSTKTHPSMN